MKHFFFFFNYGGVILGCQLWDWCSLLLATVEIESKYMFFPRGLCMCVCFGMGCGVGYRMVVGGERVTGVAKAVLMEYI